MAAAKEHATARTGRDGKGKKKRDDAFSYYLGVGEQQPAKKAPHCAHDQLKGPTHLAPPRKLLGDKRLSTGAGGGDSHLTGSAQSGQRKKAETRKPSRANS